MNDPRESHAWSFGSVNVPLETLFKDYYSDETHIDCQYKFGQMIKDRFQVICFSGAKNEGWNNEMMWAHYAENQRGVCLEFDESTLKNSISKKYSNLSFFLENVNYLDSPKEHEWVYWDSKINDEENLKSNTSRLYKELVYHKSHFWKEEDEKRLAFLNCNDKILIPIEESLKAIHLGIGFSKHYLPAIEFLINTLDIKVYRLIYQNDQYERWRIEKVNNVWRSFSN